MVEGGNSGAERYAASYLTYRRMCTAASRHLYGITDLSKMWRRTATGMRHGPIREAAHSHGHSTNINMWRCDMGTMGRHGDSETRTS